MTKYSKKSEEELKEIMLECESKRKNLINIIKDINEKIDNISKQYNEAKKELITRAYKNTKHDTRGNKK